VLDPRDDATPSRIMELTGGLGVDKAIDCSGVAAAQRMCIDAARRRGAVAFVGEAGALEIKVSDDMIRKGLTLRGSWHWNLNDAPRMWATIRGSRSKIDQLVTHTFPLRDVQAAWELQLTGNSGKVLLRPWD
jgi:L-iditol 2-dehydrogenase